MSWKDDLLSFLNRLAISSHRRTQIRELKNKLTRCQHVGLGLEIHTPCYLHHPGKISIGDYVHIGSQVVIDGRGGLFIGDHTIISDFVTILTSDHKYDAAEMIPFGTTYVDGPVHISESVWIGMHACIKPGVRVAKGAIIGLGAVVTRDIPAYAIAAGNPARVVKYRDIDSFKRLEAQGSFFVKARSVGADPVIIST